MAANKRDGDLGTSSFFGQLSGDANLPAYVNDMVALFACHDRLSRRVVIHIFRIQIRAELLRGFFRSGSIARGQHRDGGRGSPARASGGFGKKEGCQESSPREGWLAAAPCCDEAAKRQTPQLASSFQKREG